MHPVPWYGQPQHLKNQRPLRETFKAKPITTQQTAAKYTYMLDYPSPATASSGSPVASQSDRDDLMYIGDVLSNQPALQLLLLLLLLLLVLLLYSILLMLYPISGTGTSNWYLVSGTCRHKR